MPGFKSYICPVILCKLLKFSRFLVHSPINLILGLGRSPGEGNGNSLQYSCWDNLMDREVCWAIVHGVTKSQTWLSMLSLYIINNGYCRTLCWIWKTKNLGHGETKDLGGRPKILGTASLYQKKITNRKGLNIILIIINLYYMLVTLLWVFEQVIVIRLKQ